MGGAAPRRLETADVALMRTHAYAAFAIGLSRASRAIIRQNRAIALGVIRALTGHFCIRPGKLTWRWLHTRAAPSGRDEFAGLLRYNQGNLPRSGNR